MIAQPYVEDYQVSYLLGTVEIKIPGKKKPKQLVLLGLYLLYSLMIIPFFLSFLAAILINVFHDGKLSGWSLLLIPLIIGLMILSWKGIVAGYFFLWQLGGVEIIQVLPGVIKIRKSIFGIGRTQEYGREQIKALSLAAPSTISLAFTKFRFTQFELVSSGPIYMQYGERKRAFFGYGLDMNQAEKIAAILKQRLSI